MDDKNSAKRYSEKLAEVLKENQRRKEQRQFQEELAKRIQLARDGRAFYEKKDLKTAMQNYRRFLQLTAKSLGVEVKDLHPRLFEDKVRISESLLISAIVFDLAKILDRVKEGQAERAQYLRLMVLFTSGMPFQYFVAENMNKFLKYTPNIVNKNEFKAAHKALRKGSKCFIATSCYGDENAPEVERLRRFRNEVLWKSNAGSLVVEVYYAVSPWIADKLDRQERARAFTKALLDKLNFILERRGF